MTRCGTHLGYRDHVEQGTEKCAPCKTAHARRRADYRRRRYLNRGGFLVDATGTHRRLQALAAIGWSSRVLAARLSVTPQTLRQLQSRSRCWASTRDRVAALYDELSMTPGGNRTTVTWAAKRGWAVPLAWDDETIDDPKARPVVSVARTPDEPNRHRDLELEARVMDLTAAGLSAAEIAMRLRTHERYVTRVRARHREEGAA